MDQAKLSELLELAKQAAIKAGERIMQIYNQYDVIEHETKDDSHASPLTIADTESHQTISELLRDTQIPILSEEGQDIEFSERNKWEYFWLIDPLDGTKEFINKNGEFTVNIALIHNGAPVMGVVHVPALNKTYWGSEVEGAFVQEQGGESQKIHVAKFKRTDSGLKIVGSRSHMNEETSSFIETFINPEVVSMGSSLKLLMIAEGKAHIYPRFGPTMEWDTAAAHAVVKFAGGSVLEAESMQPVIYNKQDLLNPYFIVFGEGDI
jgi:3'(2'), 5'-bisphosphate nucleotidase